LYYFTDQFLLVIKQDLESLMLSIAKHHLVVSGAPPWLLGLVAVDEIGGSIFHHSHELQMIADILNHHQK